MKEACHKKTNTIGFHLYEGRTIAKIIMTESAMAVTKDWGEGKMGVITRGRYSALQNEE